MVLVNNKAAADGVIRLAVNHLVTGKRGNAHPVFVQGKVISVEIHALIDRKLDFMFSVRQQQASMGVNVLDKARNAIDINRMRQVSRQTHNDSNIGVVPFARQGK